MKHNWRTVIGNDNYHFIVFSDTQSHHKTSGWHDMKTLSSSLCLKGIQRPGMRTLMLLVMKAPIRCQKLNRLKTLCRFKFDNWLQCRWTQSLAHNPNGFTGQRCQYDNWSDKITLIAVYKLNITCKTVYTRAVKACNWLVRWLWCCFLRPMIYGSNLKSALSEYTLWINLMSTYCKVALNDAKSALLQFMACSPQGTSHYLSQWLPRSVSSYGLIRPQCA